MELVGDDRNRFLTNMKKLFSLLLLCLAPCCAMAFDFEADGVYYTIVDRHRRTVEVTHWEEVTGPGGKPMRVLHHHNCTHNHANEPLTSEHRKLIKMDEDAVLRERTAYIGKVTVPAVVRHKGVKYKVIGVGDGSFYGRRQLTEVILPPGITYIGEAAFENCRALRELIIPSAVTRIGFAAFRRCMSLTTLILPDNLRSIDLYACAFCEELRYAQIPPTLEDFPGNVFFYCIRLKSIRLLHDVPPRVGNDVGLTMDFQDMIFYVPDNVLPLYQADDFWSKQNVQTINNCSFPLTETL